MFLQVSLWPSKIKLGAKGSWEQRLLQSHRAGARPQGQLTKELLQAPSHLCPAAHYGVLCQQLHVSPHCKNNELISVTKKSIFRGSLSGFTTQHPQRCTVGCLKQALPLAENTTLNYDLENSLYLIPLQRRWGSARNGCRAAPLKTPEVRIRWLNIAW